MLINKKEMNCQFHLKEFSDTSNFFYILLQINLSNAEALVWDYTTSPTPTWNTISEADIDFSLPTYPPPVFGKGNSKNRRGFEGYDDQRLQLFRQIEGLMEM